MIRKWQKTWWLGGDLNTRPRDYDFYVVVYGLSSKTANFLAYSVKTIFTIPIQLANFYALKSAQRNYSLNLLTDGVRWV